MSNSYHICDKKERVYNFLQISSTSSVESHGRGGNQFFEKPITGSSKNGGYLSLQIGLALGGGHVEMTGFLVFGVGANWKGYNCH
jgi:hypothetical protein